MLAFLKQLYWQVLVNVFRNCYTYNHNTTEIYES